MKKILGNLLLFSFSIVLTLGMVEIVFRVTGFDWSQNYRNLKGGEGQGVIEGGEFSTTYQLNSLGLRNEKELLPKKKGEVRILVLGDSFTFGLGVKASESYPYLVEKQLQKGNPKISVINGGISGTFARHHEEFLKNYLEGINPDWVLVQIFIGNDFYDGLSYKPLGKTDSNDIPVSKESESFMRIKEKVKSIRVIRFLWDTLGRSFAWNVLAKNDFFQDLIYRTGIRLGPRAILFKEYYPLEEHLVRETLKYLRNIDLIARSNGIQIVFLLVPFREQLTVYKIMDDPKFDFQRPNRILRDFARKEEVDVIDLLKEYEKIRPQAVERLYYEKDLHWNKNGHLHAAHVITAYFEDRLN
jgi:hypothetical protein